VLKEDEKRKTKTILEDTIYSSYIKLIKTHVQRLI